MSDSREREDGGQGGARRWLFAAWATGGVLLLGHAESLLNVSTAFELLHLNEDLVYRKPIAASSAK